MNSSFSSFVHLFYFSLCVIYVWANRVHIRRSDDNLRDPLLYHVGPGMELRSSALVVGTFTIGAFSLYERIVLGVWSGTGELQTRTRICSRSVPSCALTCAFSCLLAWLPL